MSKQIDALKLALEALEVATTPLAKDRQEVLRAIAAIREALAEQTEQQEPVAWILKTQIQTGEIGEILSWSQSGEGLCERLFGEENETPLYTSVMKCNKKTDECICNELEATKKRLDSCDKLLQEEWQARQALLREHPLQDIRCECCGYMTYEREHLGCIRSAYRTQTEQEPFCYHDGRDIVGKEYADHSDVFPLYTAPKPRQWVGLTQQDMKLALKTLEKMGRVMKQSPDTEKAIVAIRKALAEQPAQQQEPVARSKAYDMIDRFLQNNLNSDEDYAEYSKALDSIYTSPQPAQQQEPVYFCDYGYEGWGKVDAAMAAANLADGMTVEAYYTSPQLSKPWVGLTDEEMRDLEKQFNAERVRTSDEEYLIIYPSAYWSWMSAIEAKLREKNT